MKQRVSKSAEAEFISREHLVRLLVEQIERTFSADGRHHALQKIAEMLHGLDEPTLRGLVYQQGLQSEDELTEPESEPKAGGTSEVG